MAAFVTGIGALIHMYSISYMADDETCISIFCLFESFIFFMITPVSEVIY
jgi:NADH-quinone oxidoreductase subunit L